MVSNTKILIIGIGNSGRSDDGLGWAFLDRINDTLPDFFDIEYRYQLHIEDAELITKYNQVIFVDADKQLYKNGYHWKEGIPHSVQNFSSHALYPETVLYLAKEIYKKQISSYILGISGVNYQLNVGLSKKAQQNLLKALSFFNSKYRI